MHQHEKPRALDQTKKREDWHSAEKRSGKYPMITDGHASAPRNVVNPARKRAPLQGLGATAAGQLRELGARFLAGLTTFLGAEACPSVIIGYLPDLFSAECQSSLFFV